MASDRTDLVRRWLVLTREVLPGMAAAQRWPIRADHCFMRVFLDHAMGGRWDTLVRRPAVRHMTDADLDRAVALAESVAAEPAQLPRLNAQSLDWRQGQRRSVRGLAAGG